MELQSLRELREQGRSNSGVRHDLESGTLHKVRRGVYGDGQECRALTLEQRHLGTMHAVRFAAVGREPTFCCTSAAVAWRLPLFRADSAHVHVVAPSTSFHRSSGDVVRHRGAPELDIVRIDDLVCTSLARTVFDVVREQSPETAIACADAALRRVAWNAADRSFDHAAQERLRSEIFALIHAKPGARGIRQARTIMAFADGRAQLPGEGVSRLYIAWLGFPPPLLQVRVAGPRGFDYHVDFGFRELKKFGEFDGAGKYKNPAYLNGRTPERVLRDEKEREDWIRGTTQWGFARWGMTHLESPQTLGERLRRFGVVPPSPGHRTLARIG